MDEFQPWELVLFLDDLRHAPDGRPSLMLQYARTSGYVPRFIAYFDPFQYEAAVRDIGKRLPETAQLLAILYPKSSYQIRFYALKGCSGTALVPYDRQQLRRLPPVHPGYQGLGDDPELKMEYQRDPAARAAFEKSLTLIAYTALYRALGERVEGLYVMEKGWSNAFRITQDVPAAAKMMLR